MSFSHAHWEQQQGTFEAARSQVTTEESGPPKVIDSSRWEWQQLSNAAACRFGQDSVLWAIIGSFSSTTAVLLVALGATGRLSEDPTLRIIVCGTGLLVSLIWLVMQAAALRRVKAYERVMEGLEASLGIPPEYRLLSGPDPETDARGVRMLPQARVIMPWAPAIAMGGWLLAFVIAVARGAT